MHLTPIQNQAIARLALIVGGATFDRLFAGVRFEEVDGDILYVYAKDENTAEMEDYPHRLIFWFFCNVISPHKQGSFDFSRTRLAFFRDLPD